MDYIDTTMECFIVGTIFIGMIDLIILMLVNIKREQTGSHAIVQVILLFKSFLSKRNKQMKD